MWEDKANPVFWLATWMGNMGLCGIPHVGAARKFSFMWQILYGPSFCGQNDWVLASIFFLLGLQKRKEELGQYSAFLTSHLVSNAYNYTPECARLRNLSVSLIPKQMGCKLLNSTNKGNKFYFSYKNAFTVVYWVSLLWVEVGLDLSLIKTLLPFKCKSCSYALWMELRSLSKHNYGQPPFHTKDTVKEVDGLIKVTKFAISDWYLYF